MIIHPALSLSLSLGLALPQSAEPATRGPAEAFIAAIDRVCPIYMTSMGMSAADAAVLDAEMATRTGSVGTIRHSAATPQVMVHAGPDSCLVLSETSDAPDGPDPTRSALSGAVRAWLHQPTSGWTSAPLDDQPGRYLSQDGRRVLMAIDQPGDGGVMVLIQGATALSQTPADQRRTAWQGADARPVDQAMLEAVNTLCAIAATPGWSQIERGEILIRHRGDDRLSVDYQPRGDCVVRADASSVDGVETLVRSLEARLTAPGQGWTRADQAWMLPSSNTPAIGGVRANYRHDDGRQLAILTDQTELQAVLWQPQPTVPLTP